MVRFFLVCSIAAFVMTSSGVLESAPSEIASVEITQVTANLGLGDVVPLDGNCGDGQCQPPEDCHSCPQDCGNCCGNNRCEPPEDCNSCPQDCPCR